MYASLGLSAENEGRRCWQPRWLMPEIELDPEDEIKLLTSQGMAIETTAETDNKMLFFLCAFQEKSRHTIPVIESFTSYTRTS